MDSKGIAIKGFSSNCLMGATEAIVKNKYNVEDINRIYFHYSFVYKNSKEIKCFSRELPITKDEFINRIFYYYGLSYYYAMYSDFDSMVEDIAELNISGESVMIEIDFFFMKKHKFYHKYHDQHMMIIYNVDLQNKSFDVCEAIFGHIKISFDEYYEYFKDVNLNRNREVFILIIKKQIVYENKKVKIDYFIRDIEKTLDNLNSKSSKTKGINALREFSKNFIEIIEQKSYIDSVFVPDMWVFMCDSMNNVNFINEFKKDYPDFHSRALNEIRKNAIISNRKWFYITMALNDISKYRTNDLRKALKDIENACMGLIEDLELLKSELMKYKMLK